MPTIKKENIRGLCCEGGGVLGCGHIGALEVLKEEGILQNLTHFAGSSAGSIIATALACKIDLDVIKKEIFDVDFNKFKDDSFGFLRDVIRLCCEFGWYKGDALEAWFTALLKKYVGNADITLEEIHEKYGTFLIITVCDVNTSKCIYMNYKTHGKIKAREAVRWSSSIPLFFKASTTLENNIIHYLIDGGTLDNYPINSLNEELTPDQVIGLKLMSSLELKELQNPHLADKGEPPQNLLQFIKILITMLHNQALKIHIHDEDWQRTIKIDVKDISSTNFDITNDQKKFLLNQGNVAAKEFFKERKVNLRDLEN